MKKRAKRTEMLSVVKSDPNWPRGEGELEKALWWRDLKGEEFYGWREVQMLREEEKARERRAQELLAVGAVVLVLAVVWAGFEIFLLG